MSTSASVEPTVAELKALRDCIKGLRGAIALQAKDLREKRDLLVQKRAELLSKQQAKREARVLRQAEKQKVRAERAERRQRKLAAETGTGTSL